MIVYIGRAILSYFFQQFHLHLGMVILKGAMLFVMAYLAHTK